MIPTPREKDDWETRPLTNPSPRFAAAITAIDIALAAWARTKAAIDLPDTWATWVDTKPDRPLHTLRTLSAAREEQGAPKLPPSNIAKEGDGGDPDEEPVEPDEVTCP